VKSLYFLKEMHEIERTKNVVVKMQYQKNCNDFVDIQHWKKSQGGLLVIRYTVEVEFDVDSTQLCCKFIIYPSFEKLRQIKYIFYDNRNNCIFFLLHPLKHYTS